MLSYQDLLQLEKDYTTLPLTIYQLAKKYNICEDTVRKNVKKFNWQRNPDVIEQIDLNRKKAISNTLNAKSDYDKNITKQKRIKTNLDKYGVENYQNVSKWKESYWSKSEAERRLITEKQSNSRKTMSSEAKKLQAEKRRNTMLAKSESERKNIYIRAINTKRLKYNGDIISPEIRDKQKKEWETYTPQQKKIKLQHLRDIWENDNIKKQQAIDKIKQNWKSKSKNELESIANKRKITWKNKSKDEIAQIVSKRKNTLYSHYSEEEIKNIHKQGMIKRYNRNHYSQAHIGEQIINILNDKNELTNYINNIPISMRNRSYIANLLGINVSHLNHKIAEYKINDDITWGYTKSKYEDELYEFIKSIYNGEIIRNTRKIIAPLELDFYLPDKNLAIEFNGTYFHSNSSFRKLPNTYHQQKSKLCEEKGIRLIHVFEYEWIDETKKEKLKNLICIGLNYNITKIYAKKCEIGIDTCTKNLKKFVDDNHLQGYRGGKFALYLKYNNKIVMCMIFGHPYFSNNKCEIEVIRVCTEKNVIVVGGLSKLWNYFISNFKYNSCVYYVNYNYYNGNSLKNIKGFKYINSSIGYVNYDKDTGEILSRNPAKNKIYKEYIQNGKLYKIYTAGTKTFIWRRDVLWEN